MSRFLSYLFSVVFHPVFVNLLNLWLLFTLFPPLNYGIPQKRQVFYILFIFISTSIIPLILVFILRFSGKAGSVLLEQKEERSMPYLITMLMYVFNYYNFNSYYSQTPTHPLIMNYIAGCAAIICAVMIINFFSKISIHTATLGGLAGLAAVASRYAYSDTRMLVIIIMLVSGLVGSARIFAGSHHGLQVYSGFALGFILMFMFLQYPYQLTDFNY